MGKSKNNPTNKAPKAKGRMVLSDDCIKCSAQCAKGKLYLERFAIKHQGNGIYCYL